MNVMEFQKKRAASCDDVAKGAAVICQRRLFTLRTGLLVQGPTILRSDRGFQSCSAAVSGPGHGAADAQ